MRKVGFYRGKFDTRALDGFMRAGGWNLRAYGFYFGQRGFFFLVRSRSDEKEPNR